MRVSDVLSEITDTRKITMQAASLSLGRHRNYVVSATRAESPQLATVVSIADAYGYDVVIRKRSDGREILVDPPERSDND